MALEYIDIVLFGAMCLDLLFKSRKYNKMKKQMGKWKRYQYNTTKLRDVLYIIILGISAVFLGYRMYTIVMHISWPIPKLCIFIPLIDYYVLWDWFLHGIYYNSRYIFYKSELYEFRRAVHIYRDLVKDHYEFVMVYRLKEGGIRDVTIRIPNEKEAFDLLATIPFEEDN